MNPVSEPGKTSVLFVCMGNICRSPTAEAVFRSLLREAGLEGDFLVDSAGTIGHNTGHPPDEEAQAHARRRGYDLAKLRGREVKAADFDTFDLILAMDRVNLKALTRLCPAAQRHKLKLLLEFGGAPDEDEVPDPYGGGPEGFERALDLIEAAVRGLLRELRPRKPGESAG